jgi:hypothetical protein
VVRPIRNCKFCLNGNYFEDRSVGIPGGYECSSPDAPEDYSETLNGDCPFFNPRMIDKCSNCGRDMDVPQWLWTTYFNERECGSSIPCCCQDCVEEMKSKSSEYFKPSQDIISQEGKFVFKKGSYYFGVWIKNSYNDYFLELVTDDNKFHSIFMNENYFKKFIELPK